MSDKKQNTFNMSQPDKYADFLNNWKDTSGLSISEIVRRLIDFYRDKNPSKN